MKIAFDIGGTHIRAALFDQKNVLVEKLSVLTPSSYSEGKALLGSLVKNLVAEKAIAVDGVAVAIAGIIDKSRGEVVVSPNLSDWIKKPLVKDLRTITQSAKIVIENDAAAAALGEANFGAGKGVRVVGYLTLSTGIGGAKVVDGVLDAYASGFEPGNQIINFDETRKIRSFRKGSFEAYASGTAFKELYGISGEQCTDQKIWNSYAKLLSTGVINCIVLWSPEIIVLGGGVAKSARLFLDPLCKAVRIYLSDFSYIPSIVAGILGDDAGLYGAITFL